MLDGKAMFKISIEKFMAANVSLRAYLLMQWTGKDKWGNVVAFETLASPAQQAT